MAIAMGWFYLDPASQPIGPYDEVGLAGLYATGYVTSETMVWAEGRAEWQKLQDIDELKSIPQQAEAYAAGAEPSTTPAEASAEAQAAAAQDAAAPHTDAVQQHMASKASKAAIRAAPAKPADPELAQFLGEISALDGGSSAAPVDIDVPERVETPPPDERQFEDDDGTVYVWEPRLRKFVEQSEAAASTSAAAAAAAYNLEDMVYVGDDEKIPEYKPPTLDDSDEEGKPEKPPNKAKHKDGHQADQDAAAEAGPSDADPDSSAAAPPDEPMNGNGNASMGPKGAGKRGAEVIEREKEKQKRAKEEAEKQAQWFDLKINTSVYVTGLPEDVTVPDIVAVFTKCGLIKETDDRQPRVKIYRDKATGMPKGDGLVTYLKEPSVGLACQILDGAPFRDDGPPMTVTVAKFEQKGEGYVPKKKARPKKKGGRGNVVAQQEKQLGWGGFDDLLKPTQVTVILKHMFHPDEFVTEPGLMGDLEDDIKTECSKQGPVDRVKVYHQNPEGVVSVKFKTEEGAQNCIQVMNGRFFGGRQLEAAMWDGVTKYYVKAAETEEEQAARLERFAQEIEAS
ncbi:hypothetical protein WJX72_010675 [[Myrmecia] bisecta]|uniref:RRM domain-containing protein n=1 Tax=[Myrmecia] bisecta TaxID=41462 RepID=A0AAW1QGH7_9CHLO